MLVSLVELIGSTRVVLSPLIPYHKEVSTMTRYILKATVEPSIAENLFYKLSSIAYGKPLTVKSTIRSKALSKKVITLEVQGESKIIESALSETRACLGKATDDLTESASSRNSLDVELSVM